MPIPAYYSSARLNPKAHHHAEGSERRQTTDLHAEVVRLALQAVDARAQVVYGRALRARGVGWRRKCKRALQARRRRGPRRKRRAVRREESEHESEQGCGARHVCGENVLGMQQDKGKSCSFFIFGIKSRDVINTSLANSCTLVVSQSLTNATCLS